MEQDKLADWESDSSMIAKMIDAAEYRRQTERLRARKRAVQLAREQGYHRLAAEIDHPAHRVHPGQLRLFPGDPTLFDEAG